MLVFPKDLWVYLEEKVRDVGTGSPCRWSQQPGRSLKRQLVLPCECRENALDLPPEAQWRAARTRMEPMVVSALLVAA